LSREKLKKSGVGAAGNGGGKVKTRRLKIEGCGTRRCEELLRSRRGCERVEEVLSGKRDLNKDQIERLSARFHVSPEVFF